MLPLQIDDNKTMQQRSDWSSGVGSHCSAMHCIGVAATCVSYNLVQKNGPTDAEYHSLHGCVYTQRLASAV
jgi:hypothetical protein